MKRYRIRNSGKYAGLACFIAAAILQFSVSAAAEESRIAVKIKVFSDSVIAGLEEKAPDNASVAITDFDNRSIEAARANLGFAVSEILTEQFQKSGKFRLVEKKQLKKVLNALELGQTGLYDSDKAASIGKLIDAQYLIVGSVTKISGFYRVSVRIVKVETGAIIQTGSIDLESELLEDTAHKYQPPRYRLHIGSSMNWFSDSYSEGDYSIGLTLGWNYNITGPHWIAFQGIYYFDYWYENNDLSTADESIQARNSLENTFALLPGYGYRIQVSRNISIQPGISAGLLAGQLNRFGNYYNNVTTKDDYKDDTGWFFSGVVQPRIDFIFMENSPVSFYIGTGYFFSTNPVDGEFHSRGGERRIQGIKLEAAVMGHL